MTDMVQTGQLLGPGGRVFTELDDWAKLPAGWEFKRRAKLNSLAFC